MRRVSALLRCAAGVATSATVGAVLVSTLGSAPALAAGSGPGGPALSGVYAGGVAVSQAKAFGGWRSRPVTVTGDYLPGDSWAGVEAPSWWTGAWSGSGTRLVIGVPILPGPAGSTTLAAGAGGAYDDHFRTLATRLVAAGMADAVLRLGWEQNGKWYPWAANGHESDYIGYWRHIVTAMRAVSGARFAFAWNPTLGPGVWGSHPEQAWPGDAYVDTISLDVYDCMWGNSTATPAQRWAAVQGGDYGLDWWASFAAAHGDLPLSFPEWGLVARADQNGGGGGDNPLFITSFLSWVAAHHVLYETYFDVNAPDGNHLLESNQFPAAAAAYRQAMAGAAAAPTASPTDSATTAPSLTSSSTTPSPSDSAATTPSPSAPTTSSPSPSTTLSAPTAAPVPSDAVSTAPVPSDAVSTAPVPSDAVSTTPSLSPPPPAELAVPAAPTGVVDPAAGAGAPLVTVTAPTGPVVTAQVLSPAPPSAAAPLVTVVARRAVHRLAGRHHLAHAVRHHRHHHRSWLQRAWASLHW